MFDWFGNRVSWRANDLPANRPLPSGLYPNALPSPPDGRRGPATGSPVHSEQTGSGGASVEAEGIVMRWREKTLNYAAKLLEDEAVEYIEDAIDAAADKDKKAARKFGKKASAMIKIARELRNIASGATQPEKKQTPMGSHAR